MRVGSSIASVFIPFSGIVRVFVCFHGTVIIMSDLVSIIIHFGGVAGMMFGEMFIRFSGIFGSGVTSIIIRFRGVVRVVGDIARRWIGVIWLGLDCGTCSIRVHALER